MATFENHKLIGGPLDGQIRAILAGALSAEFRVQHRAYDLDRLNAEDQQEKVERYAEYVRERIRLPGDTIKDPKNVDFYVYKELTPREAFLKLLDGYTPENNNECFPSG